MQMYRGWKPSQWTASGQPQIDEKSLNGLDYPEARLVCRYLTIAKMLGQLADGKNGWLKVVKPTGCPWPCEVSWLPYAPHESLQP